MPKETGKRPGTVTPDDRTLESDHRDLRIKKWLVNREKNYPFRFK